MTSPPPTRARDGQRLDAISGPIWVRCPHCDGPARVSRGPVFVGAGGVRSSPGTSLKCIRCGLSRDDHFAFAAHHAQVAVPALHSPRCATCGKPFAHKPSPIVRRHGEEVAVQHSCDGCGQTGTYPAVAVPRIGEGQDPRFGLPLYLAADIGPHRLWAYNREHLAALIAWLGASLRERAQYPHFRHMMANLPEWMKSASMRPRILKALAKLAETAQREGLE